MGALGRLGPGRGITHLDGYHDPTHSPNIPFKTDMANALLRNVLAGLFHDGLEGCHLRDESFGLGIMAKPDTYLPQGSIRDDKGKDILWDLSPNKRKKRRPAKNAGLKRL